jgi:hypothetical protein
MRKIFNGVIITLVTTFILFICKNFVMNQLNVADILYYSLGFIVIFLILLVWRYIMDINDLKAEQIKMKEDNRYAIDVLLNKYNEVLKELYNKEDKKQY